jgi:chromosome segregation ATPase
MYKVEKLKSFLDCQQCTKLLVDRVVMACGKLDQDVRTFEEEVLCCKESANTLRNECRQIQVLFDKFDEERREVKEKLDQDVRTFEEEVLCCKESANTLRNECRKIQLLFDKFDEKRREVNEKLDQDVRTFEEEVLCCKESANTLQNECRQIQVLFEAYPSEWSDGSLDCDPKEDSQLQDYETSSDSIYFSPQTFDDSNL